MRRFIHFILITSFSLTLFSQNQEIGPDKFIDVKPGTIALTNALLIDGTGSEPKGNMTILIQNENILSVGQTGKVIIPEEATVIDCKGKTVIPGLVMVHEHLFYSMPFEDFFSVGQMTFTFPRMYLAGGVTTMRTAASIQTQSDINIRDWINDGRIAGPRIDVTGPFIDRRGMMIPELTFIDEPGQATDIVNLWADLGATSFKVYMHATQADLEKTVEAAHERGFKVTGHLCAVTYREAADIGIDNLEHGFMASSDFIRNKQPDRCDSRAMSNSLRELDVNSPAIGDLIDHLVRRGVALTSTLTVFEPYTGREIVHGGGIDALAPQIREKVVDNYNSRLNNDAASIEMFRKEMIWEKRFYDAGGQLLVGTDPTGAGRVLPGYSNWRAVELLVEAGLKPVEAIKVATFNGAIYLNSDREVGTVEPGKKADLVIINGNVASDISNIRKVELVFKDGAGYNSKRMFESIKGMVGLY